MMGMSAAKSDKSTKAEASKDGTRVRSAVENSREMEPDPLRALVQGKSSGASLESVAQRMAALPGAQRRQAAMAMQRARGNRFMQEIAARAAVQPNMSTGAIAGLNERVKERTVGIQQPVVLQRQADPELEENEDEDKVLQGKFESNAPKAAKPEQAEPKPNRTGMPDRLKAGIEALSGIDMSDVRVHANSDRPARLNALAYTQGNQIYLGPGQEKHLPHEAWHAMQQKQGRVRVTRQMKGVRVNDDRGLEGEADRMGVRAMGLKPLLKSSIAPFLATRPMRKNTEKIIQRKRAIFYQNKIKKSINYETPSLFDPFIITTFGNDESQLKDQLEEAKPSDNEKNILNNEKINPGNFVYDTKFVIGVNEEINDEKKEIDKLNNLEESAEKIKSYGEGLGIENLVIPFIWFAPHEENKGIAASKGSTQTTTKIEHAVKIAKKGEGSKVQQVQTVMYPMPYYEIREYLLGLAVQVALCDKSKEPVIMMTDRDARDSPIHNRDLKTSFRNSIRKVLYQNGHEIPSILSGPYLWREDVPKIGAKAQLRKKIIEILNRSESEWRLFVFKINTKATYFPEPNLFMNLTGANLARANLAQNIPNTPERQGEQQARESEHIRADERWKEFYSKIVTVTKPNKRPNKEDVATFGRKEYLIGVTNLVEKIEHDENLSEVDIDNMLDDITQSELTKKAFENAKVNVEEDKKQEMTDYRDEIIKNLLKEIMDAASTYKRNAGSSKSEQEPPSTSAAASKSLGGRGISVNPTSIADEENKRKSPVSKIDLSEPNRQAPEPIDEYDPDQVWYWLSSDR